MQGCKTTLKFGSSLLNVVDPFSNLRNKTLESHEEIENIIYTCNLRIFKFNKFSKNIPIIQNFLSITKKCDVQKCNLDIFSY